MSDYKYYEFQKVDGRLSEKEMQELRSFSTRARITPASFTSEYHFGSFKGDANAWMEKYFDGYLYLANWGTREVQLAVPAGLLPLKTAERYCSSQAASSREKGGKLIFTFLSEEEPDGEWLEGGSHLSLLLPIRRELAHGDLRSLYLGWLMGVQAGELKASEKEPPVPPNLQTLSGPQQNLADFLRLDPDLLAVAQRNSSRNEAHAESSEERSAWIASLPAREKEQWLLQVMEGDASKIGMELQSRFRRQRAPTQGLAEIKPRTVAELLSGAHAHGEERQRGERRKADLERARQTQLAAMARERHLESLKGRSEQIWASAEALAVKRLPKGYDQVVQHLRDLRDLAEREGHQAAFKKRLALFRSQQSAKKSLMERLATANLCS